MERTAQTPSGMDNFIQSRKLTATPPLHLTHTHTNTQVCAVNWGVHLGWSSHHRPAERETSFRQQRLIILHLTLRDPSRHYSYDLIKRKERWSPTRCCQPAGQTKSHTVGKKLRDSQEGRTQRRRRNEENKLDAEEDSDYVGVLYISPVSRFR